MRPSSRSRWAVLRGLVPRSRSPPQRSRPTRRACARRRSVGDRAGRAAGGRFGASGSSRWDEPLSDALAARTEAAALGYLSPCRGGAERDARFGDPTARSRAPRSSPWIDQATDLVAGERQPRSSPGRSRSSHRVVGRFGRAGARFRGHTEHLAERLGAAEVMMAFWAERLVLSLVTTHLPLATVARARSPAACRRRAMFYHGRSRAALSGCEAPRVAPIAGRTRTPARQGLLGNEEISAIEPGITAARRWLKKLACGPGSKARGRNGGAKGVVAGATRRWWRCTTIKRPSR